MPELKDHLERLIDTLPDRNPRDVIMDVSRLAAEAGSDACEALLEKHPELLEARPILAEANFRRIREQDIAAVETLRQHRSDGPVVIRELLSGHSRKAYDRVSDMFEHVDFDQCRRLVMVGCGPNPSTIFHVFDRSRIPEIIGLDTLPYAIEMTRTLIDHLGLARVTAERIDGSLFDYRGADIIFIANMVSPKAAVLSRIADTAPANVQIVLRDPHSLGQLWAESGEQGLDHRLYIDSAAQPSDYVSLSRDLFVRRRVVSD